MYTLYTVLSLICKTSSFSSIWDQTGKSVKKVLSNHAYTIVLQSVRCPKNNGILDSSGVLYVKAPVFPQFGIRQENQ